jgi:hypothetical protein
MFKLKSLNRHLPNHASRYVFVSKNLHRSEVLTPLTGDDGQLVTEMRTSDGFINATKMCTVFYKTGNKKRFPDWEDANTLFFETATDQVDRNGQTVPRTPI